VIAQESRYNPRAVGAGGTMGLMQIKHATARGLGYTGPASGLLDPETNLTYAVRYLAGAYRAAGGNAERAIAYFRSGYYRPKRKTTTAALPAAQHDAAIRHDADASARAAESPQDARPRADAAKAAATRASDASEKANPPPR